VHVSLVVLLRPSAAPGIHGSRTQTTQLFRDEPQSDSLFSDEPMAPAVRTTVTELPESRVRVQAEVPAEEVERRVQEKARALGRELKIPGFRKGKVPPPVVLRRIGRETVLDETVRDALGRWYSDAVDAAGIAPVGDPSLDLDALPAAGEPLTFSIEIGVRPTARLGDYRGLEAPRREPVVDEQALTQQLEAMRERLARLEAVDRPAVEGDFVVVDYLGRIDGEPFEGGEARDQLLELGSGRLIPGFEEGLVGAAAGERRDVEVTFPEDYGAKHLAGRPAAFELTVKEVKQKHLPDLDDDLASDAAGFDTLEELREDIRRRLIEADEARAQSEFREAVLDAAVAASTIEVPDALVQGRASEMWERMLHSLSHQGISREAYLQISGRTEDEILADVAPEAEQALRREAVLAAVVAAEGIAPDDDAVLEALGPDAEREDKPPEELLKALRQSRRLESVREDLAARDALDLMTSEATAIEPAAAQARERLWTPDKPAPKIASEDLPAAGEAGGGSGLWTPKGP
jgi:trigger factor